MTRNYTGFQSDRSALEIAGITLAAEGLVALLIFAAIAVIVAGVWS